MAKTPAERRRAWYVRRQAALAATPKIPCACGCGTLIPSVRSDGRPAKYRKGHNRTSGEFKPGQIPVNKGKPGRRPGPNAGKTLPAEQFVRRTATRKERNGGVYQLKRGWQHTPETRARMSRAQKLRDMSGPGNPGWKGGLSLLPYGPEFTRKYKRLILERDGHQCQRCGRTKEEAGQPYLVVHHLDHNKLNNDPTNLVASCASCNAWASHHRDAPFRL